MIKMLGENRYEITDISGISHVYYGNRKDSSLDVVVKKIDVPLATLDSIDNINSSVRSLLGQNG